MNYPLDTLRNCFIHCWKQKGTDEGDKIAEENLTPMKRDAEEHGVQTLSAILRSTLRPADESCAEEVILKEVRKEKAGIQEPESGKEDDSDEKKLYSSPNLQLHINRVDFIYRNY